MITVCPNSSTAWRSSASTSALAFESRLPVGSSAKTTAGLETRARATATRCCWPPESSEGRWVRRSSRPTVRISRSSHSASGLRPAIESGRTRFSSAVSTGSRLKNWKTKPRLSRRSLDDAALTKLRRDKLGFVFQFFTLLPVLTAEENLVLPLSIAGRKPDAEWLERLIRTVGLEDRRTHRPSELSGGQQQRVAVARALVSKPAVVFADEPTGNLDSKASADVLRLLRQAVDEFGQTVIMVSHDPVAAAHADRLITLRDGRIVHDAAPGSADEVIELMKQID